jgi:heme/copper-type cytochrome/quinol oxidase subunit 4
MISIEDVNSIDVKGGTFVVKYFCCVLWDINLHAIGLEELANRAVENGHHYDLTEDERSVFNKKVAIPKVTVLNRSGHADEEGGGLLRIIGGIEGKTVVLYGAGATTVTVRQEFDLHDFPFDLQELCIDFRIADGSMLRKYRLEVDVIQFSKKSLQFTEWILHTPLVKPASVPFVAHAVLQIERRPQYYINNVVGMMSLLGTLGLTGFIIDPAKEQGNRSVLVVTLMLTAIAFKFTINDELPAVPYMTHMDKYIFAMIVNIGLVVFLDLFPSFKEEEPEEMFDLNLTLGLFCAACLVFTTGLWFLKAHFIRTSRFMSKAIEVTKKNWYSFVFNEVNFLPGASDGDNEVFYLPAKPPKRKLSYVWPLGNRI